MEPVHDLMTAPRNTVGYRRFLLVTATVLALTGGFATQRVGASAPDAMSLLNAARGFSTSHASGRFTGETTVTYADDEGEGDGPTKGDLGSRTTSKGRITGEVRDATHSRVILDNGTDGASETIVFGKAIYTRYADTVASLNQEQFAKESLNSFAAVTEEQNQLGVTSMLAKATQPVINKRDGEGTTVTVQLDPKKVFGSEVGDAISSLQIRFVSGAGGRVESLTQTWHGPAVDGVSTMRFTHWGETVIIVEPTAAQVDPTPDFQEERIGGYHDSTLVMPRTIPTGWETDYADVIDAADSDEGCDQVEVDFDDMNDSSDDAAYAYIYLLPATCAEALGGYGVNAFHAGTHKGLIQTDEDGSWVQLAIDATSVLEIDTNLPPAEIASMFADLVPLNLATGPTAAATAV